MYTHTISHPNKGKREKKWKPKTIQNKKVAIPHLCVLALVILERGRAIMAISPLQNAATAATAKAGEFPPPNNWSHGPLPRDTITWFAQVKLEAA